MNPSDKVGLFPTFRWIVDSLPRWLALVFGALVTSGMLVLLAVAVEGHIWRPSVQYKGVYPGDLFLSLAFGAAVYGVVYYLPASTQGWWQERWWHWTALVMGFGLVLILKSAEIYFTITEPNKPGVYNWGQHLSPTMLWHTFIIPVLGYLTLTLAAAVLFSSAVPWWLKALVLAGLLGWTTCAVILDNILPRPDVNLIHAPDGWWWQRSKFWRG